MQNEIRYKSFCWSLGTTSFRTKDFNRTIELQLRLLRDFWATNDGEWNTITQEKYYRFLQDSGFVTGDATRPDKDARQKTSGLADLGLVDGKRRLTPAGEKLLKISENGDFTSDNALLLPKDSFEYLKQLLKLSCDIDGAAVRPMIVLIFAVLELGKISFDELTFLLPLCIDDASTKEIVAQIKVIRQSGENPDKIIISRLLQMENYKAALDEFLTAPIVSENLIKKIGMNRKSAKYDAPYFEVFKRLREIYIAKNSSKTAILAAFKAINKLKLSKLWLNLIFKKGTTERKIARNPASMLADNAMQKSGDELGFRREFFAAMHLLKAKATLSDYFDLNRRYFGLGDIFLFRDGAVGLDILPRQFFAGTISELYKEAFVPCGRLFESCEMGEISPILRLDDAALVSGVNAALGLNLKSTSEAKNALEKLRYDRLRELIKTKFSDSQLVELLGLIERRDDEKVRALVTDNADIPTIFEYILGLAWWKISEFEGRILDFMKLSLDADLLPKSHAAGGEADIVYEYAASVAYPAHSVLLEATLTEQANQRRAEMEPVSRHLGEHLARGGGERSYCVFVANFLDLNTLSDFRSRKNMPYYGKNGAIVDGMKIISLASKELAAIIKKGRKYRELYAIFDAAHRSNLPPHEWYEACIAECLK